MRYLLLYLLICTSAFSQDLRLYINNEFMFETAAYEIDFSPHGKASDFGVLKVLVIGDSRLFQRGVGNFPPSENLLERYLFTNEIIDSVSFSISRGDNVFTSEILTHEFLHVSVEDVKSYGLMNNNTFVWNNHQFDISNFYDHSFYGENRKFKGLTFYFNKFITTEVVNLTYSDGGISNYFGWDYVSKSSINPLVETSVKQWQEHEQKTSD